MSKLQLTLAMDQYDYLGILREGLVEVEGIDLNLIIVSSGERHRRMYQHEEYDAAEFSLGTHIAAVSRGLLQQRAIPFFPRRMFPHKFFTIRTDLGIEEPADLVGKRVGIPSYENTLQLAVRSMLRNQYQVPFREVRWVAAGPGLLGLEPSERTPFQVVRDGKPQSQMLVDGDLDAMVVPDLSAPLLAGHPLITRLLADVKDQERAYFEQTRHFPIMHNILLKGSLVEQYPWAAHALLDALAEARRRYLQWVEQPHRLSFAWAHELLEEERALFGPSQWASGFRANQEQLEIMCRCACEDGLTAEVVDPGVLFVESTLDT